MISIRQVTKGYQFLLQITAALIPLVGIVYLAVYQDPTLTYGSHTFHEIAIASAILLSAFATYVTWLCYRATGEVFLAWLTLGLGGFTLLYAPHGALTRLSHENLVLFVAFGPVSRLAMVTCFLVAILRVRAPADPPERRTRPQFWLGALAVFAVAGIATTIGAIRAPATLLAFLPLLEGTALAVSLISIGAMLARRLRSPLMSVYTIAMAVFAQSSISFLIGSPWNHQWWLAHAIFAAGFFILSFGIVQAFHTTRSFEHIFSQEEMMEELRVEKTRTDEALAESQRTRQELARAEQNVRSILESVDEGIFAIDREGVCTLVNRSVERLTGFTQAELLGSQIHDVIHSKRIDGSPYPRDDCPLMHAVRNGESYKTIGEVFWRKDGTALHIDMAGAPMISEGLARGAVVSFTDLTERRALETQLEEAKRVGALGRLAASMAHEFNNVLMGIRSHTELLAGLTAANPAGQNAVHKIASSVERGKRVTGQIFQFTQHERPKAAPLRVTPWLARVADKARADLEKPVSIGIQTAGELTIRGDAKQLHEAFCELLDNAATAIESRGSVTIDVRREPDEARFSFGLVENVGAFAHFTITDDGGGMTPLTMSRIFEPFFSTNPAKTGLGLWGAHQVITSHGGQIFCESEIGRGTSFHVFLPLETSEQAAAPESGRSTARSIVLVEDDEIVASGLSALLGLEGLQVTVVTRGADAVDTIARVRPDAVVLDVGLPDIDGVEVHAGIAARWPALPVLFSTGHAGLPQLAAVLEKPNVGYLRKPYEADAIMKWLGEVCWTK